MRPPQIGMILVLVPARVKVTVRVSVVDAKPIVWLLPIPLNGQFRRIRARRRIKTSWIENSPQLLGLDIVRDVIDRRNLWYTVKDISFQLGVEVRVRVTTWMRDRHPLGAGLGRLCRRREKV